MSTAAKGAVALVALVASWAVFPLILVAGTVVWAWQRPRPAPQTWKPTAKTCPDCGFVQRPDWTACWRCSARMDRGRDSEMQDGLFV